MTENEAIDNYIDRLEDENEKLVNLKEIIKAKLDNARNDRDRTFDELMKLKDSDVKFDFYRKKYWQLVGQIEAYTDVLNLKELR